MSKEEDYLLLKAQIKRRKVKEDYLELVKRRNKITIIILLVILGKKVNKKIKDRVKTQILIVQILMI